MTLTRRPGAWLVDEHETVVRHFEDVLPQRINRERVDKAVTFFLRCMVEELWTLPGAKEVREVYRLQLEKHTADTVRQQLALQQAQLQKMDQLSEDVRQALLQLTSAMEQKALSAPPVLYALQRPRPFHNLPRPDYTRFVGRERELEALRRHLSPKDRAWQILIQGIGGVGKTSLALTIAHEYRERYDHLDAEERFEAIVWVSAKAEVLTSGGTETAAPAGLIFRTLDDIYTAISQTLDREDITRALPEDQDRLTYKALSALRTLLIVDNLESVSDERVKPFLRNLPPPTKSILTSREWVDVAMVIPLTGLQPDEAETMIAEEAIARGVHLDAGQRRRLYERTSGLPLPIKLCVSRMAGGENFDQVIRWLGNAAGDLPEYCVKGQVDLAHQRDPNAFRILLAGSLFDRSAGASREALRHVADLSLADCNDGLTLLQRLSLINRSASDRFWLLPIVQEYVGAQIAQTNFREDLARRWLAWLTNFASENGVDLDLHIERAPAVEAEYPNLLYAIRWCREREEWTTLVQLADGTYFYPHFAGLFNDFREVLDAAIRAAQALGDQWREGRYVNWLGWSAQAQGREAEAEELLTRAEAIATRLGDETELARALYARSSLRGRQERTNDSEQLARDTLAITERIGNLQFKAMAASRVAEFISRRGQFDEAFTLLDKAEQWVNELGWERGLAWILTRRGTVLLRKGDYGAAEGCLLRSIEMGNAWGERLLLSHNKYLLAQVYAAAGQLDAARQTGKEARDLFERLGMTVELAKAEDLLQHLS